jgi:FAD/FMN-containing dehydrogenase
MLHLKIDKYTNPLILNNHSLQLDTELAAGNMLLGLSATDASNYQIQPLNEAISLCCDDLLKAIRYCADQKLPILARGSGISCTDQSIGEAVIIDVSKYMTRVLELNLEVDWVKVEPGLLCSNLNACLKTSGVHFASN